MRWMSAEGRDAVLIDPRAVAAYLDKPLDDWRWIKRVRRERLEREIHDLLRRTPPRFKTPPWTHQLACFYVGVLEPRFLFLLEMGLGKSKILADLMTQHQRERRLEGALVLVPRLINVDSWVDDLAKHSDLEPHRVDVSEIEAKRELLLRPRGDVTIIDYQGFCLAMCDRKPSKKKDGRSLVRNDKRVRELLRQYNWLGLDEIHKLGNWESLYVHLMDPVSKGMEFCYGLTGTLFGKRVEALHAPYYMIDRGATFGENLGLFRAAFFQPKPKGMGTEWVYDKRMDADLHRMLQHRSLRYEDAEVPEVDLPELVQRKHALVMADEQREHYLRALQGLIDANGISQEMKAAWFRMRQITSGYLEWEDDYGPHQIVFKQNPKLIDLEATLERCADSKMVISYEYTSTGRLISKRLQELKIRHVWLWGGTKDPSAVRREFMEDPRCQVFLMNSEAGGTGNDGLQKVARYLYLYETPSSPTARKQVVKRIHRPGQGQRSYLYDAVISGSVDQGILDGLAEGIDLYERVVNGGARYKDLFLR